MDRKQGEKAAASRTVCVLTPSVQLLVVMRILDGLGLITNDAWLEEYIDFLSVQVRCALRLRAPAHFQWIPTCTTH